ncbi:MAG: XdhC family protein [Anaerolineales bacterium]|nr:XdhC family protein [Anaerolineales bacterium]
MFETYEKAKTWWEEGERLVVATVTNTWGSSPRPVGSQMMVSSSGKVAGSVSGGCVEGAVLEAGLQVIEEGKPKSLHFGVTDENAWEVGLACGGEIDVFLRPLNGKALEHWRAVKQYRGEFCYVLITVGPRELVGEERILLGSGDWVGGHLGKNWEEPIKERAQEFMEDRTSGTARIRAPEKDPETLTCFFNVKEPRPTLVAVGGVHISIPLMFFADMLNFRTVVVDPRKMFANRERFPEVDHLLQTWPEEAFQEITVDSYTAVAMLTHDPKIDDPALKIALKSEAFYVGALGSKKTQEERRKRLLEAGISQKSLDRLHAPIGLDLGGRAPEEIALAVMAEIVQKLHQRKRVRS